MLAHDDSNRIQAVHVLKEKPWNLNIATMQHVENKYSQNLGTVASMAAFLTENGSLVWASDSSSDLPLTEAWSSSSETSSDTEACAASLKRAAFSARSSDRTLS